MMICINRTRRVAIVSLAVVCWSFLDGRGLFCQTPLPTFDVATVRPAPNADPSTGQWSPPGRGEFKATHVTLLLLMQLAYDVNSDQIENKPGWIGDELYDVVAKPEPGVKLSREELRPRLQALLRERFHLQVHRETQEVRGFSLIVGKHGQHLAPGDLKYFPGFRTNVSRGEMHGHNWNMAAFAKYLSTASGFPVVDHTGLAGSYDVDFSYAPDDQHDSDLPLLNDALKGATGLMLQPSKVPVQVVVIDSVSRTATPN